MGLGSAYRIAVLERRAAIGGPGHLPDASVASDALYAYPRDNLCSATPATNNLRAARNAAR